MRTQLLCLVPFAVPLLLTGCAGNAQPPPPSPSTFAQDAHASGEIVAAAGHVFWVDRGSDVVDSIRSMPAGGGASKTTYAAPSGSSPAIEDLATDGANLYWLEVSLAAGKYHSQVKAMSVYGDVTASVLAEADTALFLVAVNASYVYFSGVDSLERVPVVGGAVETVTSSSTIASWAMAASDAGACWAAPGSTTVSCEPAGAGAPITVATSQSNVQAIAIEGSTVYWSTVDDPERPAHASVFSAPMAGGAAHLLTSDANDVVALAADENAAYVIDIDQTSGAASLGSVPLEGGPVKTLAGGFSPLDPSIVSAVHIAVGDTSVFWTDATRGLVLSAAK